MIIHIRTRICFNPPVEHTIIIPHMCEFTCVICPPVLAYRALIDEAQKLGMKSSTDRFMEGELDETKRSDGNTRGRVNTSFCGVGVGWPKRTNIFERIQRGREGEGEKGVCVSAKQREREKFSPTVHPSIRTITQCINAYFYLHNYIHAHIHAHFLSYSQTTVLRGCMAQRWKRLSLPLFPSIFPPSFRRQWAEESQSYIWCIPSV